MLLLEDAMCGLAERLFMSGCNHTLELEFRFHPNVFDNIRDSCGKFFPKFREKGRVIILDTSSNKKIKFNVRVLICFHDLYHAIFLTRVLVNSDICAYTTPYN